MEHLDVQMQQWGSRLRDDLGIPAVPSNTLATAIADEVRSLDPESKAAVVDSSPVPLRCRLDELAAFQRFMDETSSVRREPHTVRAQVVVQNYICFVYLGESCFLALRRGSPAGSTLRRCCEFLTDNPVRSFRNAVAHGNWRYNRDFSGLVFWARKGSGRDEPLVESEVSQLELDFWQSLARCTAYASFTVLAAV